MDRPERRIFICHFFYSPLALSITPRVHLCIFLPEKSIVSNSFSGVNSCSIGELLSAFRPIGRPRVIKSCYFCGRYFRTDPRVGERQKACRREPCRKARKILAQHRWTERNFRGRYSYVKEWRARRKAAAQPMIQDEMDMSGRGDLSSG